eukprot:gb/GECH01013085.1/.p1 GENE.gb/GECH01013085.1/~~gb/GECH01013085.1/.p1  ORF type:complete len:243 (+),score=49.38 gb/GECH01013085.1/:1-729(+)
MPELETLSLREGSQFISLPFKSFNKGQGSIYYSDETVTLQVIQSLETFDVYYANDHQEEEYQTFPESEVHPTFHYLQDRYIMKGSNIHSLFDRINLEDADGNEYSLKYGFFSGYKCIRDDNHFANVKQKFVNEFSFTRRNYELSFPNSDGEHKLPIRVETHQCAKHYTMYRNNGDVVAQVYRSPEPRTSRSSMFVGMLGGGYSVAVLPGEDIFMVLLFAITIERHWQYPKAEPNHGLMTLGM